MGLSCEGSSFVHFYYLLQGDPKAILSHLRNIIPLVCPVSSSGFLSDGNAPRRRCHCDQMLKPPQLAPLNEEEQHLYFESYSGCLSPLLYL